MSQFLYSPNGSLIQGTYEKLNGCALITDPRRDTEGKLMWDYSGHTEVYWDDQEPPTRDGETVFLDEEGESWKLSQLSLVELPERGDEVTIHGLDVIADGTPAKVTASNDDDGACTVIADRKLTLTIPCFFLKKVLNHEPTN